MQISKMEENDVDLSPNQRSIYSMMKTLILSAIVPILFRVQIPAAVLIHFTILHLYIGVDYKTHRSPPMAVLHRIKMADAVIQDPPFVRLFPVSNADINALNTVPNKPLSVSNKPLSVQPSSSPSPATPNGLNSKGICQRIAKKKNKKRTNLKSKSHYRNRKPQYNRMSKNKWRYSPIVFSILGPYLINGTFLPKNRGII